MSRFFKNSMVSKSVAAVLLILVVLGAIAAPFPKQNTAEAFPAFEINPVIIAGITATAINTTAQNAGVTPKFALDALAWTLAKLTIQSITRSTVNWINSGFHGSPAFVTDLRANLTYLGDAVAEDFFRHLNNAAINTTGFNIYSPFQDQLNQKLRLEYYRTTSATLGLYPYDLYNYSTDPKAFINEGRFYRGGFNAWFAANGNPANNPFGAYLQASDALWGQIGAAQQQRRAELDWGRGVLSWRGNCTPSGADAQGNMVPLSKSETCYNNSVRTPGSVIENQLEQSLGTGIRQLELADSINEIVAALMGQLVNQVLGAAGLSGISQPTAGGGRSYIDQATSASQYGNVTSSLSGGVIQSLNDDERSFQNMRNNWGDVLDAANGAQRSCGARPEIVDAISRANTQISKTNTALQNLSAIRAEIQSASQNTSANKSTQITTAIAHYQSYLSDPSTPTQSEIVEAVNESADTSDSEGPESLYTRMISLQKNCGAR